MADIEKQLECFGAQNVSSATQNYLVLPGAFNPPLFIDRSATDVYLTSVVDLPMSERGTQGPLGVGGWQRQDTLLLEEANGFSQPTLPCHHRALKWILEWRESVSVGRKEAKS